MHPMNSFLSLLLVVPLSTLLSTTIILRLRKICTGKTYPQNDCFLAGFLNGIALLALSLNEGVTKGVKDSLAVPSLIVYVLMYMFCINFLNWFIFTLTETSMHIHIVALIARYRSLSQYELYCLYNKDTIIKERIPRLLQLGQLKRKDRRLFLSGSWVLVGAVGCRIMRKILGIPARPGLAN